MKVDITADWRNNGSAFVVMDNGTPYYVATDWAGLVDAVNACRDDDGYDLFDDMALVWSGDPDKYHASRADGTDIYFDVYIMMVDLM